MTALKTTHRLLSLALLVAGGCTAPLASAPAGDSPQHLDGGVAPAPGSDPGGEDTTRADSSDGGTGGTGSTVGGEQPDLLGPTDVPQPTPPQTWQEHWFEHDRLLLRYAYNDDVAIYLDDDVNRASVGWMLDFYTVVWQYVKSVYGDIGPENRLYVIAHQGRYSGYHAATFMDSSHDFRNVVDVGPGPWDDENQRASVIAGLSLIIEDAFHGVKGSPSFALAGFNWTDLFVYEVYGDVLGKTTEAQLIYNGLLARTDSVPEANTYWFRDWFYPLWRDYGHAQVFVRFFQLLAQYFPKYGNEYTRDLNWGEYFHFMSGAAQADLKPLATTAFGWPAEWEQQYLQAKSHFPQITY